MATRNTTLTNGVSYGYKTTITAQDVTDKSVLVDFNADVDLAGTLVLTDFLNNIIPYDGKFFSPANGQLKVADKVAVAEIIELTIEGDVVTTGTADVDIRGAGAVNIAIADGDTATQVATKIALGTFTGWTVTSSDNVVTFTASAAEEKSGANAFALTTSTGITGTFDTPTYGEDAGTYALVAGQILQVVANANPTQWVV